ncbi:hypothetical protein B296_00023635 [Ensete ventricosum]|uniref:Uncharacterized protein n=1 Tax=Ensete ventricosum TaxID=4639 RepID=A0A426YMW3_ENSVE|nr:hypothetical protein B296_00023635 [Ensete ventricosum]
MNEVEYPSSLTYPAEELCTSSRAANPLWTVRVRGHQRSTHKDPTNLDSTGIPYQLTKEPKLKDAALEFEEKDIEENSQPIARTFHASFGYAKPQRMNVDGLIKHQPITILTDTKSPNDLMNGKGKQVTLCRKRGSEEKTVSTQRLEKLVEISSTSAEPSRLLPTRLHDPRMLILQEEPSAHIQPYCCPHLQRAEAKRIVQETRETRIIRPRPSLTTILYLQKLCLFICRDKLFLKCHIQLNQLWVLMQRSQISSYFYYLSQEQTMLLKVFPIDDLCSTTNDRKKIESL